MLMSAIRLVFIHVRMNRPWHDQLRLFSGTAQSEKSGLWVKLVWITITALDFIAPTTSAKAMFCTAYSGLKDCKETRGGAYTFG